MNVVTSPDRARAFLTVADVAQLLRCSEPTIRRRIRDGVLPSVQLGGPHSRFVFRGARSTGWTN